MLLRLWCRGVSLVFLVIACGCDQASEAQLDEQKNPYFLAGKERTASRDFKGAIDAFEKALERNPRSVLAHFELGVLYEQHSDQRDSDYIAAMYHYQQVIKLRPNEHPADNARQRIAGCKQELVKSEALAPVAQSLIRDNDRLKKENRTLQQQLESLRMETATVAPAAARSIPLPGTSLERLKPEVQTADRLGSAPRPRTDSIVAPLRPTSSTAMTTARNSRNHTVQAGDTAYSIARRYRVSLAALQSANPRIDATKIRAGQVLTIPAS